MLPNPQRTLLAADLDHRLVALHGQHLDAVEGLPHRHGLRLTAGKNGVTLAKASTDKGQLWKAAVYNSGFSLQNRGTGAYLSVSSNAAGGRLVLSETALQWQLALAGAVRG